LPPANSDAILRSCAGNVSEAARRLGVGRGTIYRTIKRAKPRD
jgi:transcriptional regulator of acetoin/glycerol metabolism